MGLNILQLRKASSLFTCFHIPACKFSHITPTVCRTSFPVVSATACPNVLYIVPVNMNSLMDLEDMLFGVLCKLCRTENELLLTSTALPIPVFNTSARLVTLSPTVSLLLVCFPGFLSFFSHACLCPITQNTETLSPSWRTTDTY